MSVQLTHYVGWDLHDCPEHGADHCNPETCHLADIGEEPHQIEGMWSDTGYAGEGPVNWMRSA